MSENRTKRLLYVDLARTYAILLALISHVFVSIGYFDQLGPNGMFVRQFTRMATPMFVFMFGFMVEFVYVKKAKKEGLNSINKRIFVRSFQCYIAYCLTSFSAFLGGYKSLEGFLASTLFFSDSRFGNILRAYSIMLLLTPFIIRLRIKFKRKYLFLSLIILIICYSFIHKFDPIDFGIFNHPLNMFLGLGLHKGGPSVLGALSFYFAGMICASDLNPKTYQMGKQLALIFILLILGLLLIEENFNDMWAMFTEGTYRKNNSPGYFIIGILGSLVSIWLIDFFTGSRKPSKIISFIIPIGTSSLISYTTGNMILNLIDIKSNTTFQAFIILLFFISVIIITSNIQKIPFYSKMNRVMNLKFTTRFSN